LSPEQFRAVLAHELGHLWGAHSRLAGWLYRVRQTWRELIQSQAAERHWGAFVFRDFFSWYVPFFNAYSFVQARAQEYEADRGAARWVGAATAADTLISLELKGTYLHAIFYPGFYKRAEHQAEPPATFFTEMAQALGAPLGPGAARQWLNQVLAMKTDNVDTHPCLTDRLAALGQAAHIPPPAAVTAAEHFLGAALEEQTRKLTRVWQGQIDSKWRGLHKDLVHFRQKRAALDAKAQAGPLTPEEACERAALHEQAYGPEAAVPLYQELLRVHPGHAPAHFALGRILLVQGRPEGADALEKAMALDVDCVPPACEELFKFWIGRGDDQKAHEYRHRAERHGEWLQKAQAERSQLSAADTFLPHQLPCDQIERLQKQLSQFW